MTTTTSTRPSQIANQLDMFDLLTPEEHHKACERWRIEHGNMGMWGKSHMWHCSNYDFGRNRTLAGQHPTVLMTADTRCDHYGPTRCSCVGDLLYRALCEGYGHVTGIHTRENAAVEEHLDHCWHGWRNLPAVIRKGQDGPWKIPLTTPPTGRHPEPQYESSVSQWEPATSRRSPFSGYDAGVLTS